MKPPEVGVVLWFRQGVPWGMKHTPLSDLPVNAAPEAYFSGPVWMQAQASGVVRVTFAPTGRTAWHTHLQGQTLLIVSGRGLVQKGEEHWHGAAPDSLMVHFALQAGETVWLAKVTDEEYGGK
jgi:quercetin dioxygenase-like cupin family protein